MKKHNFTLEVAAFTPNSAIEASRAGAHRIELCSGYSEGGLSPSAGSIICVRQSVSIPIHVMIRPRTGDFIYNTLEKQCIINDIAFCKGIGVNGVVFGALTREGKVDKEFTAQVVIQASPMSVTFHRAFDLLNNSFEALNDLIECGVHRVLTSGGKPNTLEGIETIAALVTQANHRIIILPGGGINKLNVLDLIKATGVREVHFSGKQIVYSPFQASPKVNLTSQGEVSDGAWYETSELRVKELLQVLNPK